MGSWEAQLGFGKLRACSQGRGKGAAGHPCWCWGHLWRLSPARTFLTFVLLTQSLALRVLLLLCHPGMCHFMGTQCEQDIPHGHPNVSRTPLSVTPT